MVLLLHVQMEQRDDHMIAVCLIVEKKSQKRRRMTAVDSCPTMDNVQVCPPSPPPLQTLEDQPDGRSLDTFSL